MCVCVCVCVCVYTHVGHLRVSSRPPPRSHFSQMHLSLSPRHISLPQTHRIDSTELSSTSEPNNPSHCASVCASWWLSTFMCVTMIKDMYVRVVGDGQSGLHGSSCAAVAAISH